MNLVKMCSKIEHLLIHYSCLVQDIWLKVSKKNKSNDQSLEVFIMGLIIFPGKLTHC